MPQQRVKVDSPIVNIEPQTINIPETVVNVSMPEPRTIRRTVERDENGRIVTIIDEKIGD